MPVHLMGCTDLGKWADEFVKAVEENPALATNRALMYEWFSLVFYAGHDRQAMSNPRASRKFLGD